MIIPISPLQVGLKQPDFINPSIENIRKAYSYPDSKRKGALAITITEVPAYKADNFFPFAISNINILPVVNMENQLDVISMANNIFRKSKPMEGIELEVLNKTFARLLSNKPTTLHKRRK